MAGKKVVNILLVEDTEEHAALIRRALEDSGTGARLSWVKDGKAALDFLYNRGGYADRADCPTPDVILLDLRLPRLHGIKVLERIKSDRKLKGIPVAVLTASDESKDIIGSYQAGADSYITKSIVFLNKGEGPGAILNTILSLTGVPDKEVVAHGG